MQTHRFRNAAGLSLAGKGGNRYLTAAEAHKPGRPDARLTNQLLSEDSNNGL